MKEKEQTTASFSKHI